ncbi:hypothetical protein [Roseospira visakhapatnamensis]|uniref:Uncharacterized protein n=1 Tax=Roseospira visakhapatnamensis TaxID=390880 RepID=A0A7W6RD98_9PROT|nr:hypothetical protein [Roseospira visakhapatnamensis]MBB4266187.1 hypothetical protein [Roseospira visakhapatnamensis]
MTTETKPRLVRVTEVPPCGTLPATRRPDERAPWIVRPEGIRGLWWIFGAILTACVLAELLVHLHPHFGVDGWFGFHAWFGFLSCVAMVLVAKGLGLLLKRKDTYYDARR